MLSALWVVLAIVDSKPVHSTRRGYWLAMLIGEPSAYMCVQWRCRTQCISRAAHSLPFGFEIAELMGLTLSSVDQLAS